MTKILNQACDIKLGETSICRIFVGSCLVWGGDIPCEFSVTPESTLIKQDGTPINIDIKCCTTWSCHIKDDEPEVFVPSLAVSPRAITLGSSGGSQEFTIQCNTTFKCYGNS